MDYLPKEPYTPKPNPPVDLAEQQRLRVFKAGQPITGNQIAGLAGSGFRVVLFLVLLLAALVLTVAMPPLGLLLLFLLGIVALTAK